jgi:hypothetical protein
MDETLMISHFENNKRSLESKENCNVTIQIGIEPNIKEINAHLSIICIQCPFLKNALTDLKNGKYIIQIPNICEEIFLPILK